MLGDRFRKNIRSRENPECRRRGYTRTFRKKREFEFKRGNGKFLFLVGVPSLFNHFADAAGMFSIEGLRHGIVNGQTTEIVGQHGCPGNGLKDGPLPAHREKQG